MALAIKVEGTVGDSLEQVFKESYALCLRLGIGRVTFDFNGQTCDVFAGGTGFVYANSANGIDRKWSVSEGLTWPQKDEHGTYHPL